jgi:hemerythrin-like domain-containing protein
LLSTKRSRSAQRGLRGVVLQVPAPQRDGDLGHAHRRAGVAGVGLLHGIHGQGADGVGHQLRAMLLYVDEFPERLHHSKESRLLFPKLRERVPTLAPVLDRLDREHSDGEHAIRELQHALLAYEVLGEPRRGAFERAVDRYTAFYLAHMAVEEREVLPAARRHLDEADWAELDAAFAANQDPLTGHHQPTPDYQPLFHKIVMETPAPIGLGPVR